MANIMPGFENNPVRSVTHWNQWNFCVTQLGTTPIIFAVNHILPNTRAPDEELLDIRIL